MRRLAPTAPLSLALLLTLAAPAAAQEPSPSSPAQDGTITVLAELSRIGGPWGVCGRMAVVGAVEYRLLRVEQGQLPAGAGPNLVVAFSCPEASFRASRVARLTLRRARPRGWASYQVQGETFGTQEADRFFVVRAEPLYDQGHRRLLGKSRAEVAREHPEAGTEAGGWVRYGPRLLVRFEGGRAVQVRAGLPPGLGGCLDASRWMGYPPGRGAASPLRRRRGCRWPGISERHRLEAGVVGEVEAGTFDLRRVASP